METNWLEDFLKLAEAGNFSRAAELRNSSQPAFSRRIRGLEEWIGVPLIDRNTHRIALTEAGHAFRPIAEDTLRRLAQGREQARQIGGAEAGTLRFAATHALSTTFFPDWLRSCGDHQDLGTISLIADNMVGCERAMLAGTADLLLCHHHPAAPHRLDPASFASILLATDRLVPVCVPDGGGAPLFPLPGDAEGPLPYLAYDETSGMGRILAASGVIPRHNAALRPAFRSHVMTALLRMARHGKGVAWIAMSVCSQDMASGRLVRAGGEEWDVPVDVRLFRPRARKGDQVEAFWRSVAAAAR